MGAAFSAFFGSCCALPLLMLTLTGTAGFAAQLVPYQKYFTLAALLFLAAAFYLVYGKKTGGEVCSLRRRRATLILLWVSTLLVLVFLIGPYFLS